MRAIHIGLSIAACGLLAGCSAPDEHDPTEVVTHGVGVLTNNIVEDTLGVGLTNTVLPLATTFGWAASVGARSVSSQPAPAVSASTLLIPIPSGLTTPYTLTVAAADINAVLPDLNAYEYVVEGSLRFSKLGVNGDSYRIFAAPPNAFVSQDVPPAPELPFVEKDVLDCAGLVEITLPAGATSAVAEAYHPLSPDAQVRAFYDPPAVSAPLELPARPGSPVLVRVNFTVGTDPFSDQLRFVCEEEVTVTCDAVTQIECVADGGELPLGRIIGNIDMLGENENVAVQGGDAQRTLVQAIEGPWQNGRFDSVPADGSGFSQGAFELENLMPSDVTNPLTPYRVYGDMSFRLGRRSEFFTTPQLWGDPYTTHPNGRVPVPAEPPVVDLENTFVMHRAFYQGDIVLRGPAPVSLNNHPDLGTVVLDNCLANIYRDSDPFPENADADPTNDTLPADFLVRASYVSAFGIDFQVAPGERTALGGGARVLFEGDLDPATNRFTGDYDLVMGLLDTIPSLGTAARHAIWGFDGLALAFRDPQALAGADAPAEPINYFNGRTHTLDTPRPVFAFVSNQTQLEPLHYCFGHIALRFKSIGSENRLFFDPRVQGQGVFAGTDFEGNAASYLATVTETIGTPRTQGTAATAGLVSMCLPHGTYDFDPTIFADEGGDVSFTGLPRVFQTIAGCGQHKLIDPPLDVVLQNVPPFVSLSTGLTFQTFARSTDEAFPNIPVSRIESLEDGVVLCEGDCGETPTATFTHNQALPAALEVGAESTAECRPIPISVRATSPIGGGLIADIYHSTILDTLAPSLNGCADVEVDSAPGLGGAEVGFEVTADDACSGLAAVSCDAEPGFFPDGVTDVTCSATDNVGNVGTCTFDITVGDADECRPIIKPRPIHAPVACKHGKVRVKIPPPVACNPCSSHGPRCGLPVSGRIVSKNGRPVRIPIPRSGKLALGPGDYEILWTTRSSSGDQVTRRQSFEVGSRHCSVPRRPPHHGRH